MGGDPGGKLKIMLTYIFIFAFLSLLVLFDSLKISSNLRIRRIIMFLSVLFFILFVGLRHNVGGDWESYLNHFSYLKTENLFDNLLSWDPGYVFVEYIAKYFGLGIYGVNTICAAIFFSGFIYFINSFNIKPSYAFFIAFPYLIMVVANGYTRQAVAVSLAMAMYGTFYKKKLLKSILFFIGAILFHKTAIVAGIIYFLQKKFSDFKIYFLIAIILFALYIVFENQFTFLWRSYLLTRMQSSGALPRIFINVYAGILFLLFYKKWKYLYDDYQIWKLFSLFSIFILIFTLITNATTVGDRILLYFYPLQIIIFSRIVKIIKNVNEKYIYFLSLILLYWGILLVWLNFAVHRYCWIPYDNLIFRLIE